MSLDPIVAAVALAALSGLPSAFMRRGSKAGQRTAAALMAASAALGLYGAVSALAGSGLKVCPVARPDALSAFFLVPIFLVSGLGSLYGLGYYSAPEHPDSSRRVQLFWGTLAAGLATLAAAKNAPVFLLGWEFMALSAFFLVSSEDHLADSRRAGWVYFIATHIGTLTLFALFALWKQATGSFEFAPVRGGTVSPGALNVLFFLALLGFGVKAGAMPLHFWLPGAHANAPSHVSAILSGVVLKTGVYGLLRWLSLLPPPPAAWGAVVLLLGAASGLLGIVFALGQRDLKRLLAYSSVENIGVILLGLGLALVGSAGGKPAWVALGLGSCLLHSWNHAFFKPLLFMGAGAVVHGSGTRRIDRLGGLAKTMPLTSAAFLIGALAACALPPLNGFVSESLLYLGFLQGKAAAVFAPALAAIGALALAAFLKAWASVFLGAPRTPEAEKAPEAGAAMLLAMLPLAALCVCIGLYPAALAPVLDAAIASCRVGARTDVPSIAAAFPLAALGGASDILAAAAAAGLVLAFGLTAVRRRSASEKPLGTWDCGYAAPTARMQYGGSSFVQPLARLLSPLLRPRFGGERLRGLFPGRASLRVTVDDAVLDRTLLPGARRLERSFSWFRRFQQGRTQNYLLYLFLAAALMLGTLLPAKELLARLFSGGTPR